MKQFQNKLNIILLITLLSFFNCLGGKSLKNSNIEKDTPLTNTLPENSKIELLKMGILKFKSSNNYNNDSYIFYSNMISYLSNHKLFNINNQNFIANLWYPYSNKKTIPQNTLSTYQSICTKYKIDYLTMGRIYSEYGIKKIEVKLYSKTTNSIIYSCTEHINKDLSVHEMAKITAGRIFLSINKQLPEMKYLNVTKGKYYSQTELNWKASGHSNHYKVARSERYNGPYNIIGKTASNYFIDKSAEPGIKYWYKVYPVNREVPSGSLISYGYISPPNPKSLSVKEIIDKRTKPWPSLSGDEKNKEKLWTSFWKEYYESYFTASLIYLIGRIYVNSGKLLVYRDFDSYYMDYNNRILYLTKNKIKIKLFSGRLVRFLDKFENAKNVKKEEALDRIVKNSLAFCLRTGEIEKKGSDGIIRYVPLFESIGISTEYYRDYIKWRSTTIIFGTYDKKLKKKLYSAWRKGV